MRGASISRNSWKIGAGGARRKAVRDSRVKAAVDKDERLKKMLEAKLQVLSAARLERFLQD